VRRVPKLRKAPRPAPKVEPKPDKTQILLEEIRDKLLTISSENIPAMMEVLKHISPWLNKVPKYITRNASNYITKKEYKIGNRILEITFTRDTNNYITGVEPRWLNVSKFSGE